MTQTTGPRRDQWGDPWAAAAHGESPGEEVAVSQQQPTEGSGPAWTQRVPPPDQSAQTQQLPDPQPLAPAPGYQSLFAPPSGAAYQAPAPPNPTAPTNPTAPIHQAGPPNPAAPPNPTAPAGPSGLWAPPPPPNGPGDTTTIGRREPRRPGWGGVIAVGAGAAVLSSLLTAGVIAQTDNSSSGTAGAPPSASSSQVAAPVSGGSSTIPDWGKVAAAVEPSVVTVQVTGQAGSGEGSGVILDTKGHVLTNNHVVTDASGSGSITVVLNDGRLYQATVVGTDPSTDLAVLQITSAPSDLRPAVLGDSSAVQVGDQVLAAGNPLGLSDTVTTGIVSAVNRPVTTSASNTSPFGGSSGQAVFTSAIQTDAAINPGNSGGALVDSRGRVIGITSSIASLGTSSSSGGQSGSIGLGFAIPINEAKDVANQLISGGKAQHAWLGITLDEKTVTVDGAQRRAAILQSVTSGTPADKAGLRSGDAVIAVNGTQVNGSDSLVALVRQFRPNTKVTLTVVRNGSKQDIQVTLGTIPNGK